MVPVTVRSFIIHQHQHKLILISWSCHPVMNLLDSCFKWSIIRHAAQFSGVEVNCLVECLFNKVNDSVKPGE